MLETTDNQFGFKKRVGCNHAIYTAYNIVKVDKVNHNALFIKLMKRKIPLILLELLENLFRVCYSCVKWNHVMSYFLL